MLTLNPYLTFRGEARSAMEFYREVFGGELSVDTFGSFGGTGDPADDDLVMHAQLETPQGFTLMAADAPASRADQAPGGFSVSISGDDEPAARGFWDALAAGGTVTLPLAPAPWGGLFGMVTDRFGTSWLISVDDAAEDADAAGAGTAEVTLDAMP